MSGLKQFFARPRLRDADAEADASDRLPGPPLWNLAARLPLTREGLLWFIIAGVLLLIGLLKGINLITLLACFLVMLVLWNAWTARRQLRAVTAQRWEDAPAFAQTPFQAAVRLTNAGRRAVGGLEVRDGQGPLRRSWFVTELGAGAGIVLHGEITYPWRGRVEAQGITIASGYPLGLLRLERQTEARHDRIVLPRLGRLHRAHLRRFLSRRSPNLGQIRGVPCHHPTAQSEFHGLRPYRPGDSPRHVHWRTSARHGELMVREYEDWPNDDLTLVLEARKPAGADIDPLLERAITLAATICWEWCRQTGDRLVLAVAGGGVTILDGMTGQARARQLLERLALEPGADDIDGDRLIAQLRERKLPAGPILVISPTESDLGARLQSSLRRRTASVAVDAGDAGGFFES
jgi:uncharacterized protein (DUF58 family)